MARTFASRSPRALVIAPIVRGSSSSPRPSMPISRRPASASLASAPNSLAAHVGSSRATMRAAMRRTQRLWSRSAVRNTASTFASSALPARWLTFGPEMPAPPPANGIGIGTGIGVGIGAGIGSSARSPPQPHWFVSVRPASSHTAGSAVRSEASRRLTASASRRSGCWTASAAARRTAVIVMAPWKRGSDWTGCRAIRLEQCAPIRSNPAA